jgi:hypothetical protein
VFLRKKKNARGVTKSKKFTNKHLSKYPTPTTMTIF